MADFNLAFAYMMSFEDAGMKGTITKDDGGRTRFGIAERYNPYLSPSGFFDRMPREEAVMLAQSTYEHGEWHAMAGDKIASQELANKILSLGVNMGIVKVIRWAQEAAGVHVDGQPGSQTIAAWNADSATPFHAIAMDAEAHYRQRVQDEPANGRYLNGWLRRAQDSAAAVLA